MRLLLDTSAYSELKRGNPAVSDLVRRAERILLSTVVIGELLFGFRRGARLEQNLRELRAFLDSPYVSLVPVSYRTADRFARIASDLRASGTPIPTNDIWVAASAMETGADLLSLDAHFEHVPGLVWVRPDSG